MTKRELINALHGFGDDEHVYTGILIDGKWHIYRTVDVEHSVFDECAYIGMELDHIADD